MAIPEYWINPLLNFEEINGLHQIKTATGTGFIAATYEGKLVLINK
jgi:hypothetical protein